MRRGSVTEWLIGRRGGRRMAREIERILADKPCATCGAWRCPSCQFLILTWWDHHSRCPVGERQKASET